MFAVLAAGAVSLAFLAASSARASGGPPSIAAGPAFGFVPSRNAGNGAHGRRVSLLLNHGGPVQSSATQVGAIYWGNRWGNSTFKGDKVSGLDTLYSKVGGTGYAHTNSEYTDATGSVDTLHITQLSDVIDTSAAPSGAPTTAQVLAEVASVTNNNPVANAYYPVYSDQPRGTAGYCAWHSTGTIGSTRVQFAFFFNLDGDPGCDPQDPSSTHSQGLEALANVTGHELSEMLTDPQLNAWYDQQGAENADKCAWTFGGNVTIGNQSWKIQGNWSNNAYNLGTSYLSNSGCIETSY